MSPKQELTQTLHAMRTLYYQSDNPAIRLAQIKGLLDHACDLVEKVGEMTKVRKEKVPA